MKVVAWSRSLTPERAEELGIVALDSPLAVAGMADVVSIHVALNDSTRGLCGADFFAAMKPGALFVNTSRGEVVDEAALTKAIEDKGVRAGLDVYADEPSGGSGDYTGAIGKNAGVYGTHHIGASTAQAQEAIAAEAVRIITVFAATGNVPNAVNIAETTPAVCALSVRHLDRPGVLAACLDAISRAGINVQGMSNTVFAGAEAAVATISLEVVPAAELLETIRSAEHVLDASVVAG
jgi:D-3-phosphoglycerate dehydrogenase